MWDLLNRYRTLKTANTQLMEQVQQGEAQIDEMIFPSTPLPPDNVYAKGAFMSKTFSLHYRFMHDASVFKLLEKKIFEPLGLL